MSLNIFRLCGDMLNMFSLIILFARMMTSRNSQAISLRSLELLFLVFLSRYLDLFTVYYSLYNSVMKIIYIVLSGTAVLRIRFYEPLRSTYDETLDIFPHWTKAVLPSFCFAALVHLVGSGVARFDPIELLWAFSICLEAVFLLPQIQVLKHFEQVECLTGMYIFGKGMYRLLYILNWIYRAHTERYYRHHYLVYACGVLQSAIGIYATTQLIEKGWDPSALFRKTTYSQPRVSRLKPQELVENGGNQETEPSSADGLRTPLLVV